MRTPDQILYDCAEEHPQRDACYCEKCADEAIAMARRLGRIEAFEQAAQWIAGIEYNKNQYWMAEQIRLMKRST